MTSATDVALRGPQLCRAAMITYRRADYWARIGLLVPSIQVARGSGTQRLYSAADAVTAAVIAEISTHAGWLVHLDGIQAKVHRALASDGEWWVVMTGRRVEVVDDVPGILGADDWPITLLPLRPIASQVASRLAELEERQ